MLPFIIAVLDKGRDDSSVREIGLLDGRVSIDSETLEPVLKKPKCFAKSYEDPERKALFGTTVDEKGKNLKEPIVLKPYLYIWANDKQDAIHRFLIHDFELKEEEE